MEESSPAIEHDDVTCFPGAVNPSKKAFVQGWHEGFEIVAYGSNCFVVLLLGDSLTVQQVGPCRVKLLFVD